MRLEFRHGFLLTKCVKTTFASVSESAGSVHRTQSNQVSSLLLIVSYDRKCDGAESSNPDMGTRSSRFVDR
jgi:hypothetical protein